MDRSLGHVFLFFSLSVVAGLASLGSGSTILRSVRASGRRVASPFGLWCHRFHHWVGVLERGQACRHDPCERGFRKAEKSSEGFVPKVAPIGDMFESINDPRYTGGRKRNRVQPIGARDLETLLLGRDAHGRMPTVVDVRDRDYMNGKIPGSIAVPSRTFPHRARELVDRLKDEKMVVFYCHLSQNRGPFCADLFASWMDEMHPGSECKVYVLSGGFSGWWGSYANDSRLVERIYSSSSS
mmetsp:Transcript_6991/g.12899  ORF Transcript_6991/g.12899 Transcript_6991/m.12899 type:complete len:240 (+) Transcript_6991:107-826(+)